MHMTANVNSNTIHFIVVDWDLKTWRPVNTSLQALILQHCLYGMPHNSIMSNILTFISINGTWTNILNSPQHDALEKLAKYKNAFNASHQDQFISYNQLSFMPNSGLSISEAQATKWGMQLQVQINVVADLKICLGVSDCWTPDYVEYVKALEYSHCQHFICAIEELANLASTGYKLWKQISKAIVKHSGAIHSALDNHIICSTWIHWSPPHYQSGEDADIGGLDVEDGEEADIGGLDSGDGEEAARFEAYMEQMLWAWIWRALILPISSLSNEGRKWLKVRVNCLEKVLDNLAFADDDTNLVLANAVSDITTTLLNNVLPQVCKEWFKQCWKRVELPSHLVLHNISSVKTIGPMMTSTSCIPPSSQPSTNVTGLMPMPSTSKDYAKILFGAYCLPHDMIHEICACINKDTGFERENWESVTTSQKVAHQEKFRPERWTQHQLYLDGKSLWCSPNTWNGFIHQQLNGINEGLPKEDHCFYIAVRGGIKDLSEPRFFFSGKAEKFVCAVLELEPRHLALKLKAFAIPGLDELDLSEEVLVARIASNQAHQAKGEHVYKLRKKCAAKRVEKSTEYVESSGDKIVEKSAELIESSDED
ncbi:uncharacterized protein F5891DRAFT_986208 [Suillus fuscotomentosus]|uniref:Uncharacterized protein n=1 Tax=Suillus fuscotomentosus TaxID=1912939 RepID=A0AAD4HDZ0_9AGAM|nr:uncharacterized protein F5891DRAFT_986208 [Suillus fuscotomentosus]KAG1893068.1 hypothetical protein F5891DRAFT_986208 [Suillus fuscotomentosus]